LGNVLNQFCFIHKEPLEKIQVSVMTCSCCLNSAPILGLLRILDVNVSASVTRLLFSKF